MQKLLLKKQSFTSFLTMACFFISLSALSMEMSLLTSYSKNSEDRAHWQALFTKDVLKRGSLAIDIKTLIKTVPRIFKNSEPALPSDWIAQKSPSQSDNEGSLTWIGHSTFLLQYHSIGGLIDPFWGDYKLGKCTLYKRLAAAALTLEEIPPLTFIAITHNHVDHCDIEALKFFSKRDNPIALVPEGDEELFKKLGFDKIVGCQWGDSVTLAQSNDSITCSFLPAAHDADHNAWWGSWLFKLPNYSIYHAGDTGNASHFQRIAEKHIIDVALLPIAPYTMRKLQQPAHIDQEEALSAFTRLAARILIPMHCCTLPYCEDDPIECIRILNEQWQKQSACNDLRTLLLVLKLGKQYDLMEYIKNLAINNKIA